MYPELVTIPLFNFTLRTYPLMVLIGFSVALFVSARQAKREGRFEQDIYEYSFWGLLSGVVGSWVLFVIVNYQSMFIDEPFITLSGGIKFPACLAIWRGGAHYVGGFIGAIIAVLIFAQKRRLPKAALLDALVFGVPLAMIFARIGCIAQGCCFGAPNTWLRFGMIYEAGTHPYNMLLAQGFQMNNHTPLLFPAELAEGIGCLFVFFALVYIRTHKRMHGQVFAAYIFLYSLLRFAIEFARGDVDRGFWLGGLVTTSQLVSLVGMAAVMAWWILKRQKLAAASNYPLGLEG